MHKINMSRSDKIIPKVFALKYLGGVDFRKSLMDSITFLEF